MMKKGERGKAIGRLMIVHINPVYTDAWICALGFLHCAWEFDLILVLIFQHPFAHFGPSVCLYKVVSSDKSDLLKEITGAKGCSN